MEKTKTNERRKKVEGNENKFLKEELEKIGAGLASMGYFFKTGSEWNSPSN